MYVSEHDITVKQPIQFVFDNVTCMKGCVNWLSMLRDAEKLSDGPAQVGSRYKHVGKFMGFTSESIMTIRVYNPPYEFAIDDAEKTAMPVSNHYTFEETPDGVRVHARLEITPSDGVFGKLSAALIARRVKAQHVTDLNTLKEMLESGVVVQDAG